jgi:hypothetical protein
MGSFLVMGLFGVILASLVKLFMASSALQFVISVVGVLVFAGLTAWDTQRLKSQYLYGGMDRETAEHSAILGALSLYLNFINIFTPEISSSLPLQAAIEPHHRAGARQAGGRSPFCKHLRLEFQ